MGNSGKKKKKNKKDNKALPEKACLAPTGRWPKKKQTAVPGTEKKTQIERSLVQKGHFQKKLDFKAAGHNFEKNSKGKKRRSIECGR